MADPPQTPDLTGTTEAANAASQSLTSVSNSANQAKESLNAMGTVSSGVTTVFEQLNSKINAYGFSLNNVNSLTEQQTAQFGLLASATLGARKAFDQLGDQTGLRTFSDQFKELQATIQNSPAYKTAEDGMKAFGGVLSKMGAPVSEVNSAMKGGWESLSRYSQAFFENADSALRLQNVYLQLAARTGNLKEVFDAAGKDLGNINSLLAAQNNMIAQTATATGLGEKQVEDFYNILGAVPKALGSTVTTLDGANKNMNMLTAAIKLANGTGRDFKSVVEDLHQEFTNYGVSGEKALTFTERFSEISNKFGIELKDVKDGLLGATGAFKTFADAGDNAARMSEALSGLMNDYVGSLKESGMTGAHAVATVKSMTDSIANLNVAQKAFLSSQTGGPGGLMGAFQIEKMMREGKIDEVFDKVRDTMQKQFGKIVTLEEASKSPQAASQLEKQMLLLQKGPLGSMIKSDQDAYRLLETFRAKQEGKAPSDMGARGLEVHGLQTAINRGTSFEEKSYTQLTAMNSHLAAIRRAAEIPSLNLVQKAGTAGAGEKSFLGADTEAQRKMREGITGTMRTSTFRGGSAVDTLNDQLRTGGPIVDKSGQQAAEAMKDFQNWYKQIPDSLKSVTDTLKQAVISGDEKTVQSQMATIEQDVKDKRAAASKMTAAQKQQALAAAQQEENYAKEMMKWYQNYGGVTGPRPEFNTAGATVGAAQRNAPTARPGGTGRTGTAGTVPTPEVQVTEHGVGGRLKVNVVVNVKDDGGHAASVSPTPTP